MPLGPGISYRDWVYLSTQDTSDTVVDLTVTTGSELIDINNLTTPRLKEVARVDASSTELLNTVVFRLEMTTQNFTVNEHSREDYMSIGVLALLNMSANLISSEIEITVKFWDSSDSYLGQEVRIFDSNTILRKDILFVFSEIYTGVKVVTVRIEETVSPAQNPTGEHPMDFGRLWIGNYLEECFDGGWDMGHVDGGKESLSIGNDSHLSPKPNRKQMHFDFTDIDESRAFGSGATWFDLSTTVSTDSDIVVLPRVETDTELQYLGIYGKLKRPVKITHQAGPNFKSSLDVVELI